MGTPPLPIGLGAFRPKYSPHFTHPYLHQSKSLTPNSPTMASRYLTMDEINKTALEHFVYQPVNNDMIAFLAHAAQTVISCDPSSHTRAQLPPSPPKTPEPEFEEDKSLPTVEEFIRQLVVSSNVQVSTLMASLVYLNRLRARLQPQARGIRCTAHRIFLASLILAAKYLNDSSPKNKHWANYTKITTNYYQFGFSRTEVNTMEKQLLFLLEWDLRIHEDDLYRELDCFLEPLRQNVVDRHARKMQEREERQRHKEMKAAARRYPSPASSRGHSRSRNTPLEEPDAYMLMAAQGGLYESPVQVYMDDGHHGKHSRTSSNGRLPYEISQEEYAQLRDDGSKKRTRRGVLGRWFGSAAAAR